MLVERSRDEALKAFLRGRKVRVLVEYDDGSLAAEALEEWLPEEDTHYLVNVPAVEVEECREAREKQKVKKVSYEGDGYSDGEMVYDTWICPNCSESYEVGFDEYEYCPNCGQHIDRLRGEEE